MTAVSKGEKKAVREMAQEGEKVDDAMFVLIMKTCRGV
jgi:hypothetical protein